MIGLFFVVKRAPETGVGCEILNSMMWVEIILIVREACSKEDDDEYLDAFQCAEPALTILFFAITHAIRYMQLTTEDRYKWLHRSMQLLML